MKHKIKALFTNIKSYIHTRYEGTNKAVYALLLFVSFLMGGFSFLSIGLPKWLAFPLFGILATIAVFLVVEVGSLLLKVLLYQGNKHLLILGILFYVIYCFCMWARMDIVSENDAIIAAVLIFLISIWFVRSFFALVFQKKKNRSLFVYCMASGLLFSAIVIFIMFEGFEDSYIDDYLALSHMEQSEHTEDLKEELNKGNNQVSIIEYGAEKKRVKPAKKKGITYLESETMNLSPYVDGYEGVDAKYRELYQGYTIKNVPLAGRIWYPEEKSNCPVLFIIHGNHNFTTQSYLGYDYLGKYLASHGYVVVSVDENFCNGGILGNLKEENDGRAVLLLENIKKVLEYTKDEQNPLYGKIDETKIALAGHSRGGEAVAIAAYFNQLDNYPEDGNIKFDYHLGIQSVIAIAPSVDQYQPTDRDVELEDVNYLLLQGANDQDIAVFMGAKQYSNVSYTGEGDYFKSYLYIAGANHGQFNTKWGKYDMSFPYSEVLNVENFLSQKQQQNVLKIFSKKFLDVTLLKEAEYKDLFYGVHKYKNALPKTVYIQGYMDSQNEIICNFEEDSDLTTATMETATIKAEQMDEWTEKLCRFSNSTYNMNKDNYAMDLKWNSTYRSKVTVSLPEYNGAGKKLSFNIVDMYNADVKEERYEALDCQVILQDAAGKKVKARLSQYCTVYPPLPVRLSKMQYLLEKNEYKHQFQTVLIPVSAFEGDEEFDDTNITKIQFLFDHDNRGKIRLDDISFTK